jgi:hypothetical protein
MIERAEAFASVDWNVEHSNQRKQPHASSAESASLIVRQTECGTPW